MNVNRRYRKAFAKRVAAPRTPIGKPMTAREWRKAKRAMREAAAMVAKWFPTEGSE